MKICLLTNIVSPHQMPLARALAQKVGPENFRYVATEPFHKERADLGWGETSQPDWVLQPNVHSEDRKAAEEWQQSAEVLLCGQRELALFEQRCARGLLTFYMSERWFKPPLGMLRMCHPRFLGMSLRIKRLLRSPFFFYLPIGVLAADDMCRMLGVLSARPRLLFGRRAVPFYGKGPLERIEEEGPVKCGETNHMLLWAYFVSPSVPCPNIKRREGMLHVVWAGRMLHWKKVDVLIRAVTRLAEEGRQVRLSLLGHGPEESGLRAMARNACRADTISFLPPVPIEEVRRVMRQADAYVLPSNGYEGWGAVVNEALLEGCCVVASRETGAAATLIRNGSNGLLFSSGSVSELTEALRLLESDEPRRAGMAAEGQKDMIDKWLPEHAAERFVAVAHEKLMTVPPEVKARKCL